VFITTTKIVAVHDGDTLSGTSFLGFGVSYSTTFRLRGVNAPEIADKPAGVAARDFLRGLVLNSTLPTQVYGQEKYGRWLADFLVDGRTLTEIMIQAGHAVAWDGKGVRP